MTEYILLFLIVFGINLLPAFAPPTWSILVWFRLTTDASTTLIVIIGASAAAAGRYLLARLFRYFGHCLSARTRRNMEAARDALERRKRNTWVVLGLFAMSPIPSNALFEAAGLAGMRLLGFTVAFFVGRLVSYSVYTYAAGTVRHTSFGDTLREGFTSPIGIAIQLALIAGLVAMTRIDWTKWLARGTPAEPEAQGSGATSGATKPRRASAENSRSAE
jgi:uncharacterized membrane protein YdjX (TVP38/TMEM64 family)